MAPEQRQTTFDADFDGVYDEELQAAVDMWEHLVDCTFYQRQIDALRAMGMTANAEREVASLARQGVVVV